MRLFLPSRCFTVSALSDCFLSAVRTSSRGADKKAYRSNEKWHGYSIWEIILTHSTRLFKIQNGGLFETIARNFFKCYFCICFLFKIEHLDSVFSRPKYKPGDHRWSLYFCDGRHLNINVYILNITIASVAQTPWGGSTFKPPQLCLGQYMGLSFYIRAALPQIRVETLIGSQANYEIKIKITIYFYKIIISYEKYLKLNLY